MLVCLFYAVNPIKGIQEHKLIKLFMQKQRFLHCINRLV